MCGKYGVILTDMKDVMESPPRVREVYDDFTAHEHRDGITPACAGSIKEIPQAPKVPMDHPRVCGKY